MRDPLRVYSFEVEIDGFVRAGFQKVSGLKATTEAIEYREGGMPTTPWKVPGMTTFDDITLERGMMLDTDFQDWHRTIFDVTRVDAGTPPEDGFRRNLTIFVKNKSGDRVKRITVFNAWPKEVNLADLDASANDILITSIILANEGQLVENVV